MATWKVSGTIVRQMSLAEITLTDWSKYRSEFVVIFRTDQRRKPKFVDIPLQCRNTVDLMNTVHFGITTGENLNSYKKTPTVEYVLW